MKLVEHIQKYCRDRNAMMYKILGSALMGVWTIINILLYVRSSQLTSHGNRLAFFFPFNYNYSDYSLWAYDISELLVYTILLPLMIFLMMRYVLLNHEGEKRKRLIKYIIIFIAICFFLTIIAFFDNTAFIKLFFSAIKGAIIFYSAYYFGRYIL